MSSLAVECSVGLATQRACLALWVLKAQMAKAHLASPATGGADAVETEASFPAEETESADAAVAVAGEASVEVAVPEDALSLYTMERKQSLREHTERFDDPYRQGQRGHGRYGSAWPLQEAQAGEMRRDARTFAQRAVRRFRAKGRTSHRVRIFAGGRIA